ncbi:MAG: hypothetical protein WC223_04075 [Bacteroidales bacterium]|jgi:hypothetical protein
MKKLIILLTALFVQFAIVKAQEDKIDEAKVPKNILQTFKEKYPTATSAKWSKTKKTYNVKFKIDNFKCFTAYNTADGKCDGATIGMSFDNLPAAVKEGFKKSEFKDCPIKEVMASSTNMETLYYLYLKCDKKDKPYIAFTPAGELKK